MHLLYKHPINMSLKCIITGNINQFYLSNEDKSVLVYSFIVRVVSETVSLPTF